jgi:hypothetical protein
MAPAGPAGPRSFHVTTRSDARQAEALRTTLRKPPRFWQATITSSCAATSEAPDASVAVPTTATSATIPIPIVRACTHPPFVAVEPVVSPPTRESQTSETDTGPRIRMVERRCGHTGANS